MTDTHIMNNNTTKENVNAALLEACKGVVRAFEAGLLTIHPDGASAGFVAACRAAIRKAEGR